jgi:putative colanic acid biosysnthesis UDP-glucose lipid carrier transferase
VLANLSRIDFRFRHAWSGRASRVGRIQEAVPGFHEFRRNGSVAGRRHGELANYGGIAALQSGFSIGRRYIAMADAKRASLYSWLDALVLMVSLLLLAQLAGVPFESQYGALMLLGGALYLSAANLASVIAPDLSNRGQHSFVRRTACWLAAVAMVLLVGYALKISADYSRRVLLVWFCTVPLLMWWVGWAVDRLILRLGQMDKRVRRAVIVGYNSTASHLARELAQDQDLAVDLAGYFDDRSAQRVQFTEAKPLLGDLSALPSWIKTHRVDVVYITLPTYEQQRMHALRDGLRDTTASVYFVPHLGGFDPIQARIDHVNGIPVIAVCETPIFGANAMFKRVLDITFSAAMLVVLFPLLSIVALLVKLTSPGPVLFKQRRYGLDGSEIVVYKFRTMTVCEDSGEIRQATRGDQRITPLGAFLRKTSIDELPQFFNVLQGRMSVVGPRPHAVAHNELYRKLIDGYMLRHKVKPGITGWAQVNGFRGETQTLDKMKSRIEFDLDYLRRWSVAMDLYIIARTAGLMLKDQQAY